MYIIVQCCTKQYRIVTKKKRKKAIAILGPSCATDTEDAHGTVDACVVNECCWPWEMIVGNVGE